MRFGLIVASGLMLVVSVAAKADSVSQPVSGSGDGFSGSGTLTAYANGNGSYTITGIMGTDVTGLIGVHGFSGNDNLLYPSGASLVDAHGFAFTATEGDTDFQVDIASSGSGYAANLLDSDNVSLSFPVTFSLSSASSTAMSTGSLFRAAVTGDVSTFDFSFAPSAVAATPEPASFALLGTGLLGMAGVVRRRMAR